MQDDHIRKDLKQKNSDLPPLNFDDIKRLRQGALTPHDQNMLSLRHAYQLAESLPRHRSILRHHAQSMNQNHWRQGPTVIFASLALNWLTWSLTTSSLSHIFSDHQQGSILEHDGLWIGLGALALTLIYYAYRWAPGYLLLHTQQAPGLQTTYRQATIDLAAKRDYQLDANTSYKTCLKNHQQRMHINDVDGEKLISGLTSGECYAFEKTDIGITYQHQFTNHTTTYQYELDRIYMGHVDASSSSEDLATLQTKQETLVNDCRFFGDGIPSIHAQKNMREHYQDLEIAAYWSSLEHRSIELTASKDQEQFDAGMRLLTQVLHCDDFNEASLEDQQQVWATVATCFASIAPQNKEEFVEVSLDDSDRPQTLQRG